MYVVRNLRHYDNFFSFLVFILRENRLDFIHRTSCYTFSAYKKILKKVCIKRVDFLLKKNKK